MEENKNLLLKGAMTYGLAMGIYWVVKYIFFIFSVLFIFHKISKYVGLMQSHNKQEFVLIFFNYHDSIIAHARAYLCRIKIDLSNSKNLIIQAP